MEKENSKKKEMDEIRLIILSFRYLFGINCRNDKKKSKKCAEESDKKGNLIAKGIFFNFFF